jgi:polygalacturonase
LNHPGSYTLTEEEAGNYQPLQTVSLAGRSGFSRTANVHGFAYTETATPRQASYTTTRHTAAGAPAPGDPGGSRTITEFEYVKKPKKGDWFLRKWFASLKINSKVEGKAYAPFSKEGKVRNVTETRAKGKTWKGTKMWFKEKMKRTAKSAY